LGSAVGEDARKDTKKASLWAKQPAIGGVQLRKELKERGRRRLRATAGGVAQQRVLTRGSVGGRDYPR